MKEQIKELRVKIDGLSQLVEYLRPIEYTLNEKELEHYNYLYSKTPNGVISQTSKSNSHQINKCHESLILAKAWLGKILGELGETTPYFTDGNRHELKDIEPTADTDRVSKNNLAYETLNHIEKVDWLREEIKNTLDNLPSLKDIVKFRDDYKATLRPLDDLYLYRCLVVQYLSEARFWLGFELQRIKEESK